jgi:integrase
MEVIGHMARQVERLSARTVAAATKPGMLADGNGLYLAISPSGAKSWVLRYRFAGRRRDLGLGSYSLVSLAEARERALRAHRDLRLDQTDPIDEKRSKRSAAATARAKAITFADATERYIESQEAGWKGGRQAEQWRQSLTAYVLPVFGDLPVADVDVALVMTALEAIWKTRTETASRVRGRIESILDWAAVRGYRPKGENPARWRGHLDKLLPSRSKAQKAEPFAALPYDKIGAFMQELRAREGMDARALEFTILTAARSGEVLNAKWDEIDLKAKMWIVPAERMKAGRPHRVALSDAAIAALPERGSSDCVFPGPRRGNPLGRTALFLLLRAMARGDLTVHGFRSCFRDWAAERTNFPSEVAEMALAHAVGSKVEAAYRRGDLLEKRAQLMKAWARFCAEQSGDDNVIQGRFADHAA